MTHYYYFFKCHRSRSWHTRWAQMVCQGPSCAPKQYDRELPSSGFELVTFEFRGGCSTLSTILIRHMKVNWASPGTLAGSGGPCTGIRLRAVWEDQSTPKLPHGRRQKTLMTYRVSKKEWLCYWFSSLDLSRLFVFEINHKFIIKCLSWCQNFYWSFCQTRGGAWGIYCSARLHKFSVT